MSFSGPFRLIALILLIAILIWDTVLVMQGYDVFVIIANIIGGIVIGITVAFYLEHERETRYKFGVQVEKSERKLFNDFSERGSSRGSRGSRGRR
jgi:hypothetical protein